MIIRVDMITTYRVIIVLKLEGHLQGLSLTSDQHYGVGYDDCAR